MGGIAIGRKLVCFSTLIWMQIWSQEEEQPVNTPSFRAPNASSNSMVDYPYHLPARLPLIASGSRTQFHQIPSTHANSNMLGAG